jgi:hypothetical protein
MVNEVGAVAEGVVAGDPTSLKEPGINDAGQQF